MNLANFIGVVLVLSNEESVALWENLNKQGFWDSQLS
jgi:hypothetical protein